MNPRIAALKRLLGDAYAAQEQAFESGDLDALRASAERVRVAEIVVRRARHERLSRPVYLFAGLILVVVGLLALLPLRNPGIALTAVTSAVLLGTPAEEADLIRGTTAVMSLQAATQRFEACRDGCPYTRIELESLRANARSSLQLRAENGCLLLDVTKGFLSLEASLLRADGWAPPITQSLKAGENLQLCGFDSALLIPVKNVLVADVRGPLQDGHVSPSLVEGALGLSDLGTRRDLAPGTVVQLESVDGYATVGITRDLTLRVTGTTEQVRTGRFAQLVDARPSLLDAVFRAPRLLEWSSLLSGLALFILGLRGRLQRVNEVLEGDL